MPTTTQRGLGTQHQAQRARLMAMHVDGSPCPCVDCGPSCPCQPVRRPMYRDPTLNVDGRALQADHSAGRRGGQLADRLLLATCNSSLGGRAAHAPVCLYHQGCGSVHSRAW